MAIGDSISAGFGINGFNSGVMEARGLTFSMGGDNNSIAIPNFIKMFNPKLYGASIGSHLAELPGTPYYTNDFLNAAQSNADSSDIHAQILHIYDLIGKAPVNMATDWKLFNVLIGANDACGNCDDSSETPIEKVISNFETNFRNAINFIYEKFPRTLVNIIPQFNISIVYDIAGNVTYCKDFHKIAFFECPCAFDDKKEKRDYLDNVATLTRQIATQVAAEWQAKNLPEFNVVLQPFSVGVNATGFDLSFLSTLDCFHPSLKAHQDFAVATWNSLLTPKQSKMYYFDPKIPFKCPTASDRLG